MVCFTEVVAAFVWRRFPLFPCRLGEQVPVVHEAAGRALHLMLPREPQLRHGPHEVLDPGLARLLNHNAEPLEVGSLGAEIPAARAEVALHRQVQALHTEEAS